ncbi:MAG: hypothetical protein R2752_05200 [Vicinamibacterales bacterium]
MTDDLETRLGRALRALPLPMAPATLLPRVMAAVRRPWYARAWVTWPRPAQALSIIAAALVVFAMTSGGSPATPVTEEAGAIAAFARITWRLLLQPAAQHLFAIAVAGSVVCAAAWSALTRLALGGRPS